jgi:glutamate synthase (ferredoxin)
LGHVQGSAGQSFACFLVTGIKVKLTGEANDYVCKGIAGGEVTICPPPDSPFKASEASLVGNTCLYGASGGRLFVNGMAGTIPVLFLTCSPPNFNWNDSHCVGVLVRTY